jgi:hypothetical protein
VDSQSVARAIERPEGAVVGRAPEEAVGRTADRAAGKMVGLAREECHVVDSGQRSPALRALRPERARAGKHTAFWCC